MTATDKKYRAVVYLKKHCPECDDPTNENPPGLYERIDCGCYYDIVVNSYREQKTARLVASRIAKLKKYRGAVPTGHWNVETDDGILEAN